jgi:hypothetical protein
MRRMIGRRLVWSARRTPREVTGLTGSFSRNRPRALPSMTHRRSHLSGARSFVRLDGARRDPGFDVAEIVFDAAAELRELRPFAVKAPVAERSYRNADYLSELFLVDVPTFT